MFQVRATEDVAAHAALPRRGEERPRPGGRTRQEGASVQAPGKIMIVMMVVMVMMFSFNFWVVVDSCTVIVYFVKHSHQKHSNWETSKSKWGVKGILPSFMNY